MIFKTLIPLLIFLQLACTTTPKPVEYDLKVLVPGERYTNEKKSNVVVLTVDLFMEMVDKIDEGKLWRFKKETGE